jgi:hypothetical protein
MLSNRGDTTMPEDPSKRISQQSNIFPYAQAEGLSTIALVLLDYYILFVSSPILSQYTFSGL